MRVWRDVSLREGVKVFLKTRNMVAWMAWALDDGFPLHMHTNTGSTVGGFADHVPLPVQALQVVLHFHLSDLRVYTVFIGPTFAQHVLAPMSLGRMGEAVFGQFRSLCI